MKKNLFSLFSLIVMAAFYAGCGNSNTTEPPVEGKVYPGAGSSYTYVKSNTDEDGNKIAGTDTTKVVLSVSDTMHYQEKMHVIPFVENGTDTTYLSYESNDDVAVFRGTTALPFPIDLPVEIPAWWTYPYVSKSAVTIMNFNEDINLDLGGFGVTINGVTITMTSGDPETISVKGTAFECLTVLQKIEVRATPVSIPLPMTLKMTTKYSYSPKLGYFVKYQYTTDVPSLVRSYLEGILPPDYVQVMTDFQLK